MPPKASRGTRPPRGGRPRGGTQRFVRRETPDFLNDAEWQGRLNEMQEQVDDLSREGAAALLRLGWNKVQEQLSNEAATVEPQEVPPAMEAPRTPSPGPFAQSPPQIPSPPPGPVPAPRRSARRPRGAEPVSAPKTPVLPVPSSPATPPPPTRLSSPISPPRPAALPAAPEDGGLWQIELATNEPFDLENSLAQVHPAVLKSARERRHFPLYFCTVAGRRSVQAGQRAAILQETPQFELRGGALGLVSSSSNFKNVPADDDLPWADVCNAKSTFLRIIFEANWGDAIVDMFDKLFVAISEHDDCLSLSGQRGLVKYFAQSRRSFHIAVDQRKRAPDISKIDERALANIVNRVIREDLEADIHQRAIISNSVSVLTVIPLSPSLCHQASLVLASLRSAVKASLVLASLHSAFKAVGPLPPFARCHMRRWFLASLRSAVKASLDLASLRSAFWHCCTSPLIT